MPKFTVLVRQWVEEIAEVEVEADSAEEAAAQVEEDYQVGDLDPDWSDGTDSENFAAYNVRDSAGAVVWEDGQTIEPSITPK